MLLDVRDLSTEISTEDGIVRAVVGVNFSLNEAQSVGIVGESGCGKSMTALSLLRLLPTPPIRISSGEIWFEGRDLLKLTGDELCSVRGAKVGMIFQEPMTSLNPVYSIGEQILEAIMTHQPKLSLPEARVAMIDWLKRVGIPDAERRAGDYPHQMSGGMRQRVMIAIALSSNPKLLIADEPTTALDVTIQAQILDLIRGLREKLGMALLLITHDLGVVAENVDEVIVMYAGVIVERAPVAELFSKPLHPYTLGLIASLPSGSGDKRQRLKGISGMVPSLNKLPSGCRFRDRCPMAKPACSESEPPLEKKNDKHWVRCFEV